MRSALLLFTFLFFCNLTFAAEFSSRYFNVDYSDKAQLFTLSKQLTEVPQYSVDIYEQNNGDDVVALLASSLDNLYYAVSDIMDIHVTDMQVKLVLLKDTAEVAKQVKQILNKTVFVPSFYFRNNNTIYISVAEFSVGVLGHELGHAIINTYFVPPPPEKMQEVLCGYVEYSLLKGQHNK